MAKQEAIRYGVRPLDAPVNYVPFDMASFQSLDLPARQGKVKQNGIPEDGYIVSGDVLAKKISAKTGVDINQLGDIPNEVKFPEGSVVVLDKGKITKIYSKYGA